MNNLGLSSSGLSPVVKNLLMINGIFFLATYLFAGNRVFPVDAELAVYYFDSPQFRWWQPLTYMFMHGGLAHIIFNMFALYSFGEIIERKLGTWRFLSFYIITGLGALALQYLVQAIELHMIIGSFVNNGSFQVFTNGSISYNTNLITQEQAGKIASIYLTPMVGASGAIFGILTAFCVLRPNALLQFFLIPIVFKAKYIVPLYIIIEVALGILQFSGDSIAHFAHIGGALFGFCLIKIWNIRDEESWI